MRTEAAKFCSVSKQTSLEKKKKKKEKWLSEKQALHKWGQADLDKHLESGRVVYRQAAGTWDVWEYMDTQGFSKALTGKHNKSWLQARKKMLGTSCWAKISSACCQSKALGRVPLQRGMAKAKPKAKPKASHPSLPWKICPLRSSFMKV